MSSPIRIGYRLSYRWRGVENVPPFIWVGVVADDRSNYANLNLGDLEAINDQGHRAQTTNGIRKVFDDEVYEVLMIAQDGRLEVSVDDAGPRS